MKHLSAFSSRLIAMLTVFSMVMAAPLAYAGPRDIFSFLGGFLAPVSAEQEVSAGKKLDASVRQEYTVSSDTALQQYVSGIGQKLARKSGKTYPFQYTVLEDTKTVNAFAGPGGYIYITTGLLKILDNEAQLAGVLAHETAHVTERHVVNQMQEQYGANLALVLLDNMTDMNLNNRLTQVGQFLMKQKFGRQDEVEADLKGVDLLVKSGYNPKGMTQLLNNLSALDGRGVNLSFLQNHPPSRERSARVQEYISRNQLQKPGQIIDRPQFHQLIK